MIDGDWSSLRLKTRAKKLVLGMINTRTNFDSQI